MLLIFVVLGIATASAVLGTQAMITTEAAQWYQRLDKPWWTPPGWVFAPVWTLLYAMMTLAASLVYREEEGDEEQVRNRALVVYGAQFLLNLCWTGVFFGLRSMQGALYLQCLLVVTIHHCIAEFQMIDPVAAWLLKPYQLWVGFATFLNWKIWKLNHQGWKRQER